MGLIVSEVYDALIEAGASPDRAKAAAGAVPPAENMATKEDIAGLKEDSARIWKNMTKLESVMATKQDIARLESIMATKQDIARLESIMATKQDIARLESIMATKQDIANIEKRLAVLSFAVYTIGPAVVAFMVKLTFFP